MNKIIDKFCPNSQQPPLPQLNGIIVLNKPSGPTSAKCISFLKKLGQKKLGHAGTLDPMASGVLIALLGSATKLASYLLDGGEKTYTGVVRLGLETDTWDSTGKILAERPIYVTGEQVQTEIRSWSGTGLQEVPPYSAAKHNGLPLYKLARNAREVPQKYKKVNISQVDILEIDMPFASFRVKCSSGTYIRSLAHSLGKRLGCGAALHQLTREYSHPYSIHEAFEPGDLTGRPERLPDFLRPLESALPHWPKFSISVRDAAHLRQGRPLPARGALDWQKSGAGNALLICQGEPQVLARLTMEPDGPYWRIIRGLWS